MIVACESLAKKPICPPALDRGVGGMATFGRAVVRRPPSTVGGILCRWPGSVGVGRGLSGCWFCGTPSGSAAQDRPAGSTPGAALAGSVGPGCRREHPPIMGGPRDTAQSHRVVQLSRPARKGDPATPCGDGPARDRRRAAASAGGSSGRHDDAGLRLSTPNHQPGGTPAAAPGTGSGDSPRTRPRNHPRRYRGGWPRVPTAAKSRATVTGRRRPCWRSVWPRMHGVPRTSAKTKAR